MEIKLTYFEASNLRAQGFTLTQRSNNSTAPVSVETYWIEPAEIETWLRNLRNW